MVGEEEEVMEIGRKKKMKYSRENKRERGNETGRYKR